jgi:hypothetical protein
MAYVAGASLSKRVAHGPLAPEESAAILRKIAEAIAYAHQHGVIHRDLKPANVMVGEFGEVYVMDWGLARTIGSEDARDLRLMNAPSPGAGSRATSAGADVESPVITMDGEVLGTPCYMAPEQAQGRIADLGPRSDVYSTGAMLYHLLAGEMPYVPAGTRVASRNVLRNLVDGPPRPLHALRDGFSGPNGVYTYSSGGVFPTQSYQATNYWVDVVFDTPPPTSYQAFADSVVPATPSVNNGQPIELGVKLRSSVAGQITALRFYKGTANTGVHVGHLWTSAGALLGTATFSGETASGWQQVALAPPVTIAANTTYVASYYSPSGFYANQAGALQSAPISAPPLTLLQTGTDGPNAVFNNGASAFPATNGNGAQYFVDVAFVLLIGAVVLLLITTLFTGIPTVGSDVRSALSKILQTEHRNACISPQRPCAHRPRSRCGKPRNAVR